jgi:hypothetical protein
MSAKLKGELSIDKSDFGWIKVGGQVTQSSSMGLFAARVQRGSHILEQKNVGDAVCASKRQNPFPKEPRHGKDLHLLGLSPTDGWATFCPQIAATLPHSLEFDHRDTRQLSFFRGLWERDESKALVAEPPHERKWI